MLSDSEKALISQTYQKIAQALPGFLPRAAQRQMIAEIAKTFAAVPPASNGALPPQEGERLLVIEGPTGVGKSLAYLLAGAVLAFLRQRKLVISSATVALQNQLLHKDLPLLIHYGDLPLTVALAKGRGRYLCPFRLERSFSSEEATWLFKPETHHLEELCLLSEHFSTGRWNGDRDELPTPISDLMWSQVSNNRHGCLKAQCPHRAVCPFYQARDQIQAAEVIIVNHDLLLSDLNLGGGVILPAPDQCFYCLDEGHHLAKSAIDQFSATHDLGGTLAALETVGNLLKRVQPFLKDFSLTNQAIESASGLVEGLKPLMLQLESLPDLALTKEKNQATWLLDAGELPVWLQGLAENMASNSLSLLKALFSLQEKLQTQRKDQTEGLENVTLESILSELGFLIGKIEAVCRVWGNMIASIEPNKPPIARWFTAQWQTSQQRPHYYASASPISAAEQLASDLWAKAAGVVLTSATLQALGSFELLLKKTGLHFFPDTRCVALASPFSYEEQGEIWVPPLKADPTQPAAHTQAVIEILPSLIDHTGAAGTLILFTSRRQMLEVIQALPESLQEWVLVQGSQPQSTLLETHFERIAQGQASILVGLDSFSEGLDLPGAACRQVIIVKLPFSMPDDPVDKTLSAWIEQRGGNPFMEIAVPEASLKLIQAVGRLIRTETDYGRITLLDTRILTKFYGKRLRAALPPFKWL